MPARVLGSVVERWLSMRDLQCSTLGIGIILFINMRLIQFNVYFNYHLHIV